MNGTFSYREEFQKLYQLLVGVRQRLQQKPNRFFESVSLESSLDIDLLVRGNQLVVAFFGLPVYQQSLVSLLRDIQKEVSLCDCLISSRIEQLNLLEKSSTPEFKAQYPEFSRFYGTISELTVFLPAIFQKFESYERVGNLLPLTEVQLSDYVTCVWEKVKGCSYQLTELARGDFWYSDRPAEDVFFDLSEDFIESLGECSSSLKDISFLLDECLLHGMVFSKDFLVELKQIQEQLPWLFLDSDDFIKNPPIFYRNDIDGIEMFPKIVELLGILKKAQNSLVSNLYLLVGASDNFSDFQESEQTDLPFPETQEKTVETLNELDRVITDLITTIQKGPSCLLTAETDVEILRFSQKIQSGCFLWGIARYSPGLTNSLEIEEAFLRVKKTKELLFALIGPEESKKTSGVIRKISNMLTNF